MKDEQNWMDRLLRRRVWMHVGYWLTILLGYPSYALLFGAGWFGSFVVKLFYLPGQILGAYLLIYVLISRLLYRGRYFAFLIVALFCVYLFSTLAHVVDDFGLARVVGESHPPHTFREVLLDFFAPYYLYAAIAIPLLTAGIQLTRQHYEERREVERLEREKARTELQMLKAQLHPRFLFNTLEHLHALTLRESDAAPEVVVKLSEMLDYILYEANVQRVSVAKELTLIRHYVDLEVLRYGGRLDWQFNPIFLDPDAEVAPLLLLSAVEQAFKYGVSEEIPSPRIWINLTARTERLELEITANRPWLEPIEGNTIQEEYPNGNLRRRLDLTYPGQYQLTQKIREAGHYTRLTILLAKRMLDTEEQP